MLEDQENYEPALKQHRGVRYTITTRYGTKTYTYTRYFDGGIGNGQTKFAFTLKTRDGRTIFMVDIQCSRPLPMEKFNIAFYGNLPDGSLAFRGYIDSPEH